MAGDYVAKFRCNSMDSVRTSGFVGSWNDVEWKGFAPRTVHIKRISGRFVSPPSWYDVEAVIEEQEPPTFHERAADTGELIRTISLYRVANFNEIIPAGTALTKSDDSDPIANPSAND